MICFDYLVPSLNMKFPYAGRQLFSGVFCCRICGQVSAGVVNSSTRSLLLLERSIDRITEPARGWAASSPISITTHDVSSYQVTVPVT